MNKKLQLVLVVGFTVGGALFYQNSRSNNPSVLGLTTSGLKVTAPITFNADENVTAVEFRVSGDIIKVECTGSDFQVIKENSDGCVMANFEGGAKAGTIGKVTFVENKGNMPAVSGILGDQNGDDAQNGKFSIEY